MVRDNSESVIQLCRPVVDAELNLLQVLLPGSCNVHVSMLLQDDMAQE
jgi:hypothetical protein